MHLDDMHLDDNVVRGERESSIAGEYSSRRRNGRSTRGNSVSVGRSLVATLLIAGIAAHPGLLWAAPTPTSPIPPVSPPVPALASQPEQEAIEAAPITTPPRVLQVSVSYPEGARGFARVLLEVVVQKDGSVGSAELVEGFPPFSTAAQLAATGFKFEPATRGGRPVAARVRLELHYAPPPPEVAASPARAEPDPGAVSGQVTRVQVLGEVAPGTASLSSAEVRMLPGAFGDPFRAISVLPGVGQLVTGLPLFFVRGAPSGNLGFFIDGIRVPLLFHAFLGPSVIHPELIERVELHAGGYPASLGRFAGGVVSADLTEPKPDFGAYWSVRLFDAGAFVNAPFAGGRGNAILGGRYSYSALLLSLASPARDLSYWDYQALVSYDLSSRSRISVFAFGAYDFAATEAPPARPGIVTDEEANFGDLGAGESAVLFHRLDLRLDQRFGESSKLRAAVTLGSDATRGAQGLASDLSLAGRLELRSQLSKLALLRAGANAGIDSYELSLAVETENYTDVVRLFPPRDDFGAGAWLDMVLDVAPRVTVTPGLRVDRYSSGGRSVVGVSPRLAANFRVNESVSIEHALGVADQPPNFVPGVLPGVAVGGLPGGLQRSVQTSAGVRTELPASFSGTTTVYHNAHFGITDPFGQNQDLELDAEEAFVRSTGQSVGLELSLQRRMTGDWGGSLSYTLSRATRSHGRVHTLYGYDRPHVANLGANYNLGRSWLASARAIFYSGVPGSRSLGERRVFDQERAAPFFRADVRLEKRFVLSETAWWGIVLEVMNATLSREVLRRACQPTCRDESVGPIVLPNAGVMGQF